MIVPLMLLGGAIFGGLRATKTCASLLGVAVPLGQRIQTKKYERDFRIGFNPALDEHRSKKAQEKLKKGIMPKEEIQHEMFSRITIPTETLPPHMQYLAGDWCLSKAEHRRLLDMIRRKQLEDESGPYAERLIEYCKKNGLVVTDVGRLTFGGGPKDFDELMFVSKNRLNDPIIKVAMTTARSQKSKSAR